MMKNIETKVKQAILTNKLNPTILGERNWYNYYINVMELVWSRNNHDGYKIDIYSDSLKRDYLTTVII